MRAWSEDCEIWYGDETHVNNGCFRVRGYALRNSPPVLKVNTHREKKNALIVISTNGDVRYTLYDKNFTQEELIKFLKRLIRTREKKIFFLLDRLSVHRGKRVEEWAEENKEKIEIFYFSKYSPELNPVEYINNGLKGSVHSGKYPRTAAEIEHKIRRYISDLQHDKDLIKAFFKHKNLVYI